MQMEPSDSSTDDGAPRVRIKSTVPSGLMGIADPRWRTGLHVRAMLLPYPFEYALRQIRFTAVPLVRHPAHQ